MVHEFYVSHEKYDHQGNPRVYIAVLVDIVSMVFLFLGGMKHRRQNSL